MPTKIQLKCLVCNKPRKGKSIEVSAKRENTLCDSCYALTKICICGCQRTFPKYNGRAQERKFFHASCYLNVPEKRERARNKRSKKMKELWKTNEYRKARENPEKFAKTPMAKLIAGRERFKELYRNNSHKYKEMVRNYRSENPEIHAQQQRRRYLKKRNIKSNLRPHEWEAICKAYNNKCVYCGEKPDKLTQDHIIPLAQGGPHIKSNIVPACSRCNRIKWDGPPLKPIQAILL